MDKPAVLILSEDAGDYLPLLTDLTDLGVSFSTAHNTAEAQSAWAGQPVVLGQPDLAAEVLQDMPEVRWIQSTWAGITPFLKFGRPGLQLTGVKDVFSSQISEYVLACLLAWETRLFKRFERQESKTWDNSPSGQLSGKTLCIMGTGSIGRHLAMLARPFAVNVLGFNLGGAATEGFDRVYTLDIFHEFLAQADYLVAILPDTPGTYHLLDTTAFEVMKDSAYLVNVGRGNVINEPELAGALNASALAGAALDVFQQEPLPGDDPLWSAKNCLVTAHIAAQSRPTDIADIFIRNYQKYQRGDALDYLVDFDRGY